MSEHQDANAVRKQETLTREENQVTGVLQDYLDQLLIVATESRVRKPFASVYGKQHSSTEIRAAETRTKAAQTKPISDNHPELLAAEPLLGSVTTLTTLPEEIQDWDPYAEALKEPVEPDSVVADMSLGETLPPEPAMQTEGSVPEVQAKPILAWDSAQGVECLIFKVGGLKLAIPLSMLGGVYPSDDKVTPLFGQADWSMGVWQADGQKLTVVDSARLIMPERQVSLADEGYDFLIQLDRAPWALACQEIVDTVTLVSESIKWRSDVSRRPWLAGTVISEMCALLDVSGLIGLLDSRRSA